MPLSSCARGRVRVGDRVGLGVRLRVGVGVRVRVRLLPSCVAGQSLNLSPGWVGPRLRA